jgi:hypothetical protein
VKGKGRPRQLWVIVSLPGGTGPTRLGKPDLHQNRRRVPTASLTQVRQPIYKQSVACWKNYENALASLFAKL